MNRLLPERKHALLRLRKECRPVIQFPVSYPLFVCLFCQSLCFFHHVLDRAYVQESLFGDIVRLSVHDHLESSDRIFDGDHDARHAGELFRYGERL